MTRLPSTAVIVAALERGGYRPQRIGPGTWLAECPSCRSKGRFGLLEIRTAPDGTLSVDCEDEPSS
jgi:hypothetical protein